MQAFFSHAPCTPPRTPTGRFAAWVIAGVLCLIAAQAHAWSLDDVAALASQRAEMPFKPASQAVPPELATMDYDDYRDIRFKADSPLWRADKLAYEANFFHVGRQGDAVRVHEITPAGVKRLPYDPSKFDFGKNKLSPKSWGDIGYGGVRAFSNLNSPTYKDELIVFSGASYFRALGAGQRYGLSARGLAVDTAGPAKEEFPRFTDFWLEKPAAEGGPLTIYALMDSERMTGAYRFDVKPGEQTVTDVQARVYLRATDKPVTTLGLAPLTSMFFFGENQPRPGDFRPEVHDSDGLMIATDDGQGGGEWLWRPLQNPAAPLVTSFAMQRLKGFGLMQRDRNFHSYEDTEARYELRPSAWVTPLDGFGAGRVELLQFATPDETHDNVAAYWVPEKLPAPGQPLALAYQIAWQGKAQQLPPNGWVTQTRRGIGYSKLGADALGQQVQFVVDFAGPALDALPEDAKVEAIATASANARVVESLAYRNPATGAWRMTLRVERLKTSESTQANQPIELRAFLQNNQHTLSETWTYLITN
ncbi:MAG: glucan biosynthesis protein G [Polaromonas sp.]